MSTYVSTRVAVLDPATGIRTHLCRGPLADAGCSAPEGPASCRGRVLLVELPGQRQRIRLIAGAGGGHCPLAPLPHPWVG